MFKFGFGAPAAEPSAKYEVSSGKTSVPCGFLEPVFPVSSLPAETEAPTLPPHAPCSQCDARPMYRTIPPIASGDALDAVSDVVTGVYEGGFKLWECSLDLVRYIHQHTELIPPGCSVMEIGCGHGLPGIAACAMGAAVVLQDFNREVLEGITVRNAKLNLPEDALPRCRFVYGDWSDVAAVVAPLKFDVLLTAETIYNTDYYPKLCGLILATLVPGGVCLLAAKRFYFGVGGGTRVFEQIAATYGLDVTVLEVLEDKVSNIRELCAVRHAVKGGT